MRDPILWSIPLGRWFGIQVKLSWMFPVVAGALIVQTAISTKPPAIPGAWIDLTIVMGLGLVSVLLHEFGHCIAARRVGGDATEVILWPLGGLAAVDLPQQPRAHFLTAAAGPLTNFLLAVGALLALQFVNRDALLTPSWDPTSYFLRDSDGVVTLYTWAGVKYTVGPYSPAALLSWMVRVNYILCLLNLILVGFPMDGGRMLQSALWPFYGYRQSMVFAIFAGFVTMICVIFYCILAGSTTALCLAVFIGYTCKTQLFILETGGEDSLFGYDFSQGYTSLERDLPPAAPPRPRRLSFWQRLRKERAAQRQKREQEERINEERRMDELLQKVQREGITALTDEERRFMKRVSDRYRNRH